MLPPMWRLVKSVALVRCRWLRASSCFFSFSNGGNGPKGGSHSESSFNGELGFHEQFWQRQDTCDYGYEMRGLHHLFIVGNHAVLGQLFRVSAVQGFFLLFLIILYFFFLFGYFCFLEEFWIFFGGKEGFMAFWRHFKPFGGFSNGFMGF